MLKRIADYSKSKRGNVVLGTSIQMLSVFVLFIKQIAMVPLYLATIDIATYGAWIAVQGVVGIFYVFNPGFSDFFRQAIASAHGGGDLGRVRESFSQLVLFQVIIVLLIAGIGLFLPVLMGMSLFLGERSVDGSIIVCYYILLAGVAGILFSQIYATLNMALMRAPQVALVALVSNVFSVLVTLILLPEIGVVAIAVGAVTFSLSIIIGNILIAERLRKEFGGLPVNVSDCRKFGGIKNLGYTLTGRIFKILLNSLDGVLVYRFGEQAVVSYDIIRKILSFGSVIMDKVSNQLVAPIANRVSQGVETFRRTEFKLYLAGAVGPVIVGVGAVFLNKYVVALWVGSEFYISFTFNAVVSLFLAGMMSARWWLNLSFSKGDFRLFSFGYAFVRVGDCCSCIRRRQ